MSTTYTTNVGLGQIAAGDRAWDVPTNANVALLDGLAPLGGLCVSPRENPSSSLDVAVAAGTYRNSGGTFTSYAGNASFAVAASLTSYLYLTDGGTLTASTSAFPSTAPIVRLAVVVAGSSTITSVADARVAYHSTGVGVSLPLAGGTFADAGGVVVVHTGTTNGTQVGGAASEKLGVYGVAPVVQPSGAGQAAVGSLALQTLTVSTGGTPSTTLAAATNTTSETDSSTGTASATVADVGASFSQSGLNNIHASLLARLAEQRTLNTVLINSITSLGTQLGNALTDLNTLKTLANANRSALVATGWMKGSA